jgi:hypothetical protein
MKARDSWLYRPVWLVLVGAAVCNADTQHYAAYDMFAGDVISTARWSFYAYYTYFRNVQASAGGTLPAALVYETEHHGAPEVETWTGYFRGTVTVTPSLPETYHHTVLLSYEQRDLSYHNPHDPLEEKWDNVTDTYHTRLRVDEHANTPSDTAHLSTLPVQTAWSENSGWINGHLYPGEQFGQQLLPADVDVFRVDTDAGVYCVETEANFDIIEPALSIVVFKKAAGDDAYDGEWIARTNHYNIYGSSGTIDMRRQRVYFTLENDSGAYVQISPGEGISPRTYRVRVFRTRPVILVHGIECYPKVAERDLPLGRNALGHWNDYLPWDGLAYPCVCHSFCWDSFTEHLYSNGEGVIGKILLDVERLQNQYSLDVVLIGHSMGGYFVRYALKEAAGRIYKAVTLGTPHYGRT